MNKNGFTLIELLIIIGILALMGGLFSVNMTRILNKTNESTEMETNFELTAAADVYLAIHKDLLSTLYNDNRRITISIKDLKKAGLINRDDTINGIVIKDSTHVNVELGSHGELVFDVEMSDN